MFSTYKSQAPQTGRTYAYVLRGLRNRDGSHPIVHIEHLGEDNKPFWLEVLAKSQANARSAAGGVPTPAEMDKDRREERALNRDRVIRHSARHLENVFHDDGTPATDKDISGFILSIPDGDFDRLYAAAENSYNFRDYPIAGDPAAIAGE